MDDVGANYENLFLGLQKCTVYWGCKEKDVESSIAVEPTIFYTAVGRSNHCGTGNSWQARYVAYLQDSYKTVLRTANVTVEIFRCGDKRKGFMFIYSVFEYIVLFTVDTCVDLMQTV